MTQLKSLAHKDWPYAGTAHEWRGFAVCRPLTKEEGELIQKSLINSGAYQYDVENAIYQKQNFGPELP